MCTNALMPKDIPIFIGIIPQRVNQSLLDIVVCIYLCWETRVLETPVLASRHHKTLVSKFKLFTVRNSRYRS